MNRPAEELYNIIQDPYCEDNLENKPELQKVKERLRTELENWMDAQGDTGRLAELETEGRQARWRKASKKQ